LWVSVHSVICFHSFLLLACFFQWQIFITFKSCFTSSSHFILGLPLGLQAMGFYSIIFLFSWCSSIHSKCPDHAILLDLISVAIFFLLVNLSCSSLALILQELRLVYLDQIFSAEFSFKKLKASVQFFIFMIHVSRAVVTVGLIIVLSNWTMEKTA
jgi:hypothetical protein